MHKTRVSVGKCERDSAPHKRTLTGPQFHVGCGDEIHSRVTTIDVTGYRHTLIESSQQYPYIGHEPRDYPEPVSESSDALRSNEQDSGAEQTNRAEQDSGARTERPYYSERLYAAWWVWPLPLAMAGLLAAEVHMGYPGVRMWLPYVVLLPLAVAVLLWLGRTTVRLPRDGQLWVSDAHLPLEFVEGAELVAPAEKRKALGPNLDPAAFVIHRPWIRPMVRVWLNDPNDPTPYWLISTRHPERLVERLQR